MGLPPKSLAGSASYYLAAMLHLLFLVDVSNGHNMHNCAVEAAGYGLEKYCEIEYLRNGSFGCYCTGSSNNSAE